MASAVRVDKGERRRPPIRCEGGQRRPQGVVHVPGMHDHVAVREFGSKGILEALCPLFLELEATHHGERWRGLQSAHGGGSSSWSLL